MDRDDGKLDPITGFLEDNVASTGLASDEYAYNGLTAEWHLEMGAVTGQVVSEGIASGATSKPNSGNVSDAAIRPSADILVMGYHTIYDLNNTDLPAYVREHGATLTFPEKLMLMLMHVDRSDAKSSRKARDSPLAWTDDGMAFVIRDQSALCSDWLPVFFQQAKFSSFTRKLYRWGFRQIKYHDKPKPLHSGELYFGSEHFQRDNKSLLSSMRSLTAIKSKRQQRNAQGGASATGTTMQLFPPPINAMPFFQQSHNAAMAPSMAPEVAFPPPALPSANQFDMTNPFIQQAFAQAQLQLTGNGFQSDHYTPPAVQYQDVSASNLSNDYFRQLAPFNPQPINDPPQYPFSAPSQQQALPQMPLPQQMYDPVLQQEPQMIGDPNLEFQQQQLLRALQQMLEQSQPSDPGQHLPPDAPR
ncbi:hypothetical protein MPSEU_000642000 [Mayamaea pseudoterrestris]|nr:hypothetical protein MPSEU_000642000 [Mayamaea pseudoterrestris]